MKYVITETLNHKGMELMQPGDTVFVAHDPDPRHYEEELRTADAFIVRAAPAGIVSREVMEAAPSLKVVGRTGVGFDSVDVQAAADLGIPVVITPGANNRSVAEHTLCMMLALSKNLIEAQLEAAKGNWGIRDAGKQFELYRKKCGIIGLGRVGRDVAALCRGIGMEVLAFDPFLTKEQIEACGCEYYEDYRELMKDSDVVTVHVPLSKETEDLITKRELALMKPTALLINNARGGIVNEADLIEALNAGTIAGAGLDVFVGEVIRPGNPLLTAKNLVFSPHSASATREAMENMAMLCVQGCQAVCEGKKWKYVAEPRVYEHPKWKDADWA